jgi:hypothetical protein
MKRCRIYELSPGMYFRYPGEISPYKVLKQEGDKLIVGACRPNTSTGKRNNYNRYSIGKKSQLFVHVINIKDYEF